MSAELDVNSVIDKLLDVRGARPGKQVSYDAGKGRALHKKRRPEGGQRRARSGVEEWAKALRTAGYSISAIHTSVSFAAERG